ncbi:hypothetical protein INR49_026457 [Caranx melampygus]|nr:hypothetical protein INR49_026457 [Caranx melampygus]
MSPMKLCVPGDKLCSVEDCIPGTGVYLRHGYIYSSLAGYVLKKNEGEELPVISVVRETETQLLPDVGAIVTCKVTSINPRFAKVHILYVGSTPLKDRFRGTIRKEDVRATEKDKISLGDVQSNYLLTTAENELGVVVAHSEAGVQMVPISWCEMQCPQTHTKEFRKVARCHICLPGIRCSWLEAFFEATHQAEELLLLFRAVEMGGAPLTQTLRTTDNGDKSTVQASGATTFSSSFFFFCSTAGSGSASFWTGTQPCVQCLAAVKIKPQPGHPQQCRCQTGQEKPNGITLPSPFFTLSFPVFFTPTSSLCPKLPSTEHYPQGEPHSYEEQPQSVAACQSKVQRRIFAGWVTLPDNSQQDPFSRDDPLNQGQGQAERCQGAA